MKRIDLPPQAIDKAVAMLRQPKSVHDTAREFGISATCLRNNLKRAGLFAEFADRSPVEIRKITQAPKLWDERIYNKFLVMKLRQA